MRSRSGLAGNKGTNIGKAYIASLLVLWAVPCAASSGIHVDCDQPGSGAHGTAAASIALDVEFVDHGITKAGIGQSDIADTAGNAPLELAEVDSFSLSSRADAIIQKVFDENGGSQKPASDLVQIESSELKPLASTEATSGAIGNNAATRSESVTTNIGSEIDGIEIRLPGVSDAELLRFRRQMYRTDI